MTTHRYTAQEMLDEADRLVWIVRTGKFGIRHEQKSDTVAAMLRQAAADLQESPTREELAIVIATSRWKQSHPDKIPPMWMMVMCGSGSDNARSVLTAALVDADALITSGKVQVRSE
jgi:hypothetical protein